ncbi:MAG: hypothetical protein ACKOEC_19190, partial [Acidimicrobiia bacterium]
MGAIEGLTVASGEVIVSAGWSGLIWKISPSGELTRLAGQARNFGEVVDGMAASRAPLWYPDYIATDSQDNVYFSSAWRNRVFKISSATGQIALLAGNGDWRYAGDGSLAARAGINPRGIAVDVSGNMFIADGENHRIRRVDALTGVITTFAGNGVAGFSGDGGPAVLASLNRPMAVAVDSSSNVFVADYSNFSIRRINPNGVITTVAGVGSAASWDDRFQVGAIATESKLSPPMALAIDTDGAVLAVLEWFNQVIKLKPEGNLTKIELIAGSAGGSNTFGADGDAATARLDRPTSVSTDAKGDYFIVEGNGLRVRKVDRSTRAITTIAGTGQRGFFGDGGAATAAWLDSPSGIAVDSAGNVLFADSSNNRVRVVHCAAEARTANGSSCSTSASSATVGNRVLVTWSVTGVSSCLASGAWSGDKLATGSEWVTLSAAGDKNFGLTCKSFSGSTSTFSVPVSVAPAPVGEPRVTITASSSLIKAGSTVRLTWSSVNATSCTKAGAWTGSAALSGSEESAALSSTSTFEIRCTGPTGLTKSASTKVEVVASAPVISKFISTPAGGVPLGDSVVLSWETTGAQRCEASNGWQGVQATK